MNDTTDKYDPHVLMLLRHGASDCCSCQSDHDRNLSDRGREQVSQTAQFIRINNLVPDIILCSTAERAVESCDIICEKAELDCLQLRQRSLYLALPDEILREIQSVPDEFRSILIVGHNSGLEQLACNISPGIFLHRGLPTAGLVAFESSAKRWMDFHASNTTLTHVFRQDNVIECIKTN